MRAVALARSLVSIVRLFATAFLVTISAVSSFAAGASVPEVFPGLVFHAAPKPLASGAIVADWPHFLGPRHDATTPETKLLDRWPATGPDKVWEMEVGEGYACPVFASGRLVYFHRLAGKETVDCLDPETGRRFWRFDYPVEYEDRYGFSPGPRSSAVVNDETSESRVA